MNLSCHKSILPISNGTVYVGFTPVKKAFKAGPNCTHDTAKLQRTTNVYVLIKIPAKTVLISVSGVKSNLRTLKEK